MRRCYQIALEGIPQSEWDLHDYLDIVRMWNLSRSEHFDLTLDHDERGLYVRCRDKGTLLLGLTHDLQAFEVHKSLGDLILVDHVAAIRRMVTDKDVDVTFPSAGELASEIIRKEIQESLAERLLAPKLNLDLMKTRPRTQSGRMSWSTPITADPGPMTRWYSESSDTLTPLKGSTT